MGPLLCVDTAAVTFTWARYRSGASFWLTVSLTKKTPGLTQRPGGIRLRLPTRDREGGVGGSRLACAICGEPLKLLQPPWWL